MFMTLSDISEQDLPLVGGKAWNLARLARLGLPVPTGAVITTTACRRIFKDANCLDLLDSILSVRVDDEAHRLATAARSVLSQQRIPDELREQIELWWENRRYPRLAVRSSAVAEDGKEASFAGQFTTVLNVKGLSSIEEAIRSCWLSSFSDGALDYSRRMGLAIGSMAVVLQRMLSPDAAGVAFTRSPIGSSDNILIESAWGAGEAIVSGRTSTDAFELDSKTGVVVARMIRQKLLRAVLCEDGGLLYEKIPEEQRWAPSLSNANAESLAAMLMRIKLAFEGDQDVEWACEAGKLHILQARPISVPSAGCSRVDFGNRLMTCVDIGESWTGVMSRLGQSFAAYYFEHTHPALYKEMGLRETGDTKRYAAFINGRCYADLSYLAYLCTQSALLSDQATFLERYSTPELDLSQYKNPYGKEYPVWRSIISNFVYAWTQLNHWFCYKRRAEVLVKARHGLFRSFRERDLSAASLIELDHAMDDAYSYFHEACRIMAPPYFGAFIFLDILKLLCKSWLDDAAGRLSAQMKSGASNLRNAEISAKLEAIADYIRQKPSLYSMVVASSPAQLAEAFRERRLEAQLSEQIEGFLAEHGMRGTLEMDLSIPRWIDDPEPVFNVLRTYVQREGNTVARLAETARRRSEMTKAELQRLTPFKRLILHRVLRQYMALSTWREDTRMSYLLGIWMVRKIVMEVGRRLAAEGDIAHASDTAHLEFAFIRSCLRSGRRIDCDRNETALQRQRHALNLRLPPPPLSFIGSWIPSLATTSSEDVIRGLPASTGYVEARARVITDLREQMCEFEAGEILVAPFTDTAWTALFTLCSAVVTDIGSQLSHSSILSRELGVPCVVNAGNATGRIRTGDVISVDGFTGHVKLLSSQSSNVMSPTVREAAIVQGGHD